MYITEKLFGKYSLASKQWIEKFSLISIAWCHLPASNLLLYIVASISINYIPLQGWCHCYYMRPRQSRGRV